MRECDSRRLISAAFLIIWALLSFSSMSAQVAVPTPMSSTTLITPSASQYSSLQSASGKQSPQKPLPNSPLVSVVKRVLDGLNKLQGLLITIFTAVLVLYNRSLAKETTRLRQRETEPKLEVYLLPYEGGSVLINMAIRNVGGGAARNIKWQIDADEADLEAHGVQIHKMALFKVLHYLPSEEKILFYFGSAVDILKEPALKPLKVRVSYNNDPGNNPQADEFVIDLQPLVGMTTIGTPPPYEIANALKAISKDLNQFLTGFQKPVVRTIDEIAYQERERKRAEEIRRDIEENRRRSS